MDILLDNPLATMSGSYFLMFYAFVIFSALVILYLVKSNIDKSDKLNLPSIPPNIDPFEIAYLRGGANEMARSVIFSLMQKGFIELKTETKTSEINKLDTQTSVSGLPLIEQTALSWIGNRREAKDVFEAKYGLITHLENHATNYHRRLESAQLLTNYGMQQQLSVWKWTFAAGIALFGIYKNIAPIAHGNFNFLFTIVLGLVGVIVIAAWINLPRFTKLGTVYLERLQNVFGGIRFKGEQTPNTTQSQTAFAGVDPMLLSVGVFGSVILAGTVYDSYNQAFARAQNQSGVSGSSCGSGCGSSCSTSDSGSSCSSGDSGGSSCGSGCGGGCGGGCS